MRHFPIFLSTRATRIVVSGGGETAIPKLRLLLKSEALIDVYDDAADPSVRAWANAGALRLIERQLRESDLADATLVYAANDCAEKDSRVASLAAANGVLVNVVDNLDASDFITPAIVDRDPVTVAIGTEGTAPVLARRIKSEVEAILPQATGLLAKIAAAFRPKAEVLPKGAVRRRFWDRFFFETGPRAFAAEGKTGATNALDDLLDAAIHGQDSIEGRVVLVGAGPGDPDFLTRKALKLLHDADVIIHDRLVSNEVLELARREAVRVAVGKKGHGPAFRQEDINALMISHAQKGHLVVRLKGGDPSLFGRLAEELEALRGAGVAAEVVPGITTASAAAASAQISLTQRGRNADIRFLTGHDVHGFADHDWRALARQGTAAAIYMGRRASRFIVGRMLMHGGDPAMPVTVMANVSRTNQVTRSATLLTLPEVVETIEADAPVLIFLGLAPDRAITLPNVLEGAR